VILNQSISRWGKFRDFWISFRRFYQTTFVDSERQMAIDILQGDETAKPGRNESVFQRNKPQTNLVLIFLFVMIFILLSFLKR
jgi:hypothetical protein